MTLTAQTGTYTGTVVAKGDATLRMLAYDITGFESDWELVLLDNPNLKYNATTTAVANGTVINVQPLLQELEASLRCCVEDETGARFYAKFVAGAQGLGMSQGDVTSVFTLQKTVPGLDCNGAARVAMAMGLIDCLKNGEFAALYQTTTNLPLVLDRTTTMQNTRVGDWLYFANDPGYTVNGKPRGDYPGENVIEVSPNLAGQKRFVGYEGGYVFSPTRTYAEWCVFSSPTITKTCRPGGRRSLSFRRALASPALLSSSTSRRWAQAYSTFAPIRIRAGREAT